MLYFINIVNVVVLFKYTMILHVFLLLNIGETKTKHHQFATKHSQIVYWKHCQISKILRPNQVKSSHDVYWLKHTNVFRQK